MMRLGNIRADLEQFDYCELIFNLSSSGCDRGNLGCKYVYELLQREDDYEIPYNCYEIVYDWDDFIDVDGVDCVCFYDDDKGFLENNKKFFEVYGKPREEWI